MTASQDPVVGADGRATPSPSPQFGGEVPTDGEDTAFHGTNPWSGPYLVLAIMIAVLTVVGGIIVAFVAHWL